MIQFQIRIAQNGDVSIAVLRADEELGAFNLAGAKMLHMQLSDVIEKAEGLTEQS